MINTSCLSEIFPVQLTTIPELTAYQLNIRNDDLATIGGRLSFRLHKVFPGRWIWTYPWIITDAPQSEEAIMAEIEKLWQEHPTLFQGLLSLKRVSIWQPTAQVQADFAAKALWTEVKPAITQKLQEWSTDLPTIRISRTCSVRGWVVQGEPALSISVDSRILAKQDVQEYLRHKKSAEAILDLMVADKESSLKGIVVGLAGTVAEHRKRLLGLASTEASKSNIRKAADDEVVVQVSATGHLPYDYVARALQIIVRTSDYPKFNVDGKRVTKHLRLAPQQRSDCIRELSQIARNKQIISRAYNSSSHSRFFLNASTVRHTPNLLVGKNQRLSEIKDQAIRAGLQRSGFYKRVAAYDNTPIAIGVLNALPHIQPDTYTSRLLKEFEQLHFASRISHVETVTSTNRHQLDQAIHQLQASGAHILLALFPDEVSQSDDMRWGPYDHFKSLTVGGGISSQVVHQSTLQQSFTFALGNIALGMLSKLGNVPYVLADPLPYADIVVGIDVARRRKTRLSGSLNATAIARIYQSNGEFLQYAIHDAQLEGETIPPDVLHALFPPSIFTGKRVVIHRDGIYRGEEKQTLKAWAQQLNAQFHLVELRKSGTPRLYQYDRTGVQQPAKGSAIKLNDYQAFLVSSLPPFKDVTPYPIHVCSEPPFPIEHAIHSVLALTLLHYGSLRTPRMPITIHYSDEIAYLALKGIKPKNLEGNIPFWL